jgi:hypothetical protein
MAWDGLTMGFGALLTPLVLVCACAVSVPSDTTMGVSAQPATVAAQQRAMGQTGVWAPARRADDERQRAAATRTRALRPDRVLTPGEEAKRDLLIRLVVDADGSDTPFPSSHYPREHQRITMLKYRRSAAAKALGSHLAHDSIVAPLAACLAWSRPLLPEEITGIRVVNQEHATALSLLSSESHTRRAVLRALAQSGSHEAIPVIMLMGFDPQLGRDARECFRALVWPHVPRRLMPPYGRDVPDSGKQAAVSRLAAWWKRNRRDIQLTLRSHY